MADNLLKEAIADAKLVRETAIENAREAMLEAFKPQLDKIVTKSLRKEGLQDTSNIATGKVTVDNPGPVEPSKDSNDSSEVGEDGVKGSEVLAMGKGKVVEGAEGEATDSMSDSNHGVPFGKGKRQEKVALPEGEEGLDIEIEPELGGGEEVDLDVDGDEADLDLEAIIKELEADSHDAYGSDEGGMGGAGDAAHVGTSGHHVPAKDGFGADEGGEGKEVVEDWDDPMAGAKVDGWKTGSKFHTEASEGDMGGKETKAGKPESSGEEGAMGGKVTKAGKPEVDGEHETTLEEILREMEADESEKGSEKIAKENAELKGALKEHRSVIKFLRAKINEVNMLNAKLLYTNKLFRAYELNGAQKMNIVETFDRCTTLREVKLVYSAKAESLGGSKKSAKSITEGFGSKPVGSTKPKADAEKAEVLTETADEVIKNRLRKLAGITLLKS